MVGASHAGIRVREGRQKLGSVLRKRGPFNQRAKPTGGPRPKKKVNQLNWAEGLRCGRRRETVERDGRSAQDLCFTPASTYGGVKETSGGVTSH